MNIVIYGLSKHQHIKKYGLERRRSLSNIKTKHSVDFKLFVDEDKSLTEESLNLVGKNTELIDVRKHPSPNLSKLTSIQKNKQLGYKGMCLFYFSEFPHYLGDYDYALRLDGDSRVASKLNLDNFIDSNKIYGYVRDKLDTHDVTCKTLPVAIKKYIKANKINILCKKTDINCWNYYNNFHFSKMSFWKSKDFTDFAEFIHRERGIEKHRWGDSTLQANAVRMFCPSGKIKKFKFKYIHNSHGWKNFK